MKDNIIKIKGNILNTWYYIIKLVMIYFSIVVVIGVVFFHWPNTTLAMLPMFVFIFFCEKWNYKLFADDSPGDELTINITKRYIQLYEQKIPFHLIKGITIESNTQNHWFFILFMTDAIGLNASLKSYVKLYLKDGTIREITLGSALARTQFKNTMSKYVQVKITKLI